MQRALHAEKERDEMKNSFSQVIMEMQKRFSMVQLISKLKLNAITKGETQSSRNKELSKDNTNNGGTAAAKYFDKNSRVQGQTSWEQTGGREGGRVWEPARSRVTRFTPEKSPIQDGCE